MNERFQNSSRGTSQTRNRRSTGSGSSAVLPERHLQAYLLARETVRRVQRTASLFGVPRSNCASGP